ncbi:FG-GAP repeat domain-containing protein [Ktedonospora formicarum]|uniref:VCBS repeat-containing protein n=1 Tax=Ktedonospora formicarum TaxID=2778364 RepID=A0A8J3IB29_9CHLR|nr:VCBS repeat-containing protein [Ktedonospora formicarum]GHO49038.1 hypothetical protein KSX_72010 [Ktedonospora formicarum]
MSNNQQDYEASSLTPGQQVIALGDFNHDGNLDIVVTSTDDNNVLVYLNNSGDGTFQAGSVSYPVGATPIAVAVGDFNRDGNLDIVTGNDDGTVTVLLNYGDGTFQPQPPIPCSFYSHSIAVGDFNRDGNLDILTANYDDGTVTVLLGNGDGGFQAQTPRNVEGKYGNVYYKYPWAFAVGDFNDDGNLDIVFVDDDSFVWIGLGNGDGNFQPATLYVAPKSSVVLLGIAVGDFTNDGNLDIVTANPGNLITIYSGNGNGTFQPHYPQQQ